MASEVCSKTAQFFATLDMKCEMPARQAVEGITPFLEKTFTNQQNFWNAARKFQALKGTYSSDSELIYRVADLIKEDPRNFLVLAHLHRQIRFTNLELTNFLFDREKLDDIQYFSKLMQTDPVFETLVDRAASSKSWAKYVGSADTPEATLATMKKVLFFYLSSETKCWPFWKSRIENDESVPLRIAEFVVNNEDLKQVIERQSVLSALERSLRTVNVEVVKSERGEFGSRRVHEILESSGFSFESYPEIKNVETLSSFLLKQNTLVPNKGFIYKTEKAWKIQEKVFDFVLISNKKIQFVIEANYFTTSMSKIREVVTHFIELKKACRGKYRLIYITDGMGWFGLAKSIKKMIEFEIEEQHKEHSRIPFLMNLQIFTQEMTNIKAEFT